MACPVSYIHNLFQDIELSQGNMAGRFAMGNHKTKEFSNKPLGDKFSFKYNLRKSFSHTLTIEMALGVDCQWRPK